MKIVFTVALVVLQTLSVAHEFWLQPNKFVYKRGEILTVSFMVGENFMGEPWDLKKNRVEKLDLFQLGSSVNLLDSVTQGVKDNLHYTLKNEGTQLVAMQSTNAFIEMEAEEFNAYLKEEGLDDVLSQRKKNNTLTAPTKEFYSRHAKLLIQVGDKRDDAYKKVLGHPVEIVPEKNPYTLKVGDVLRFKILFEGKPVFGVRSKVWNRYNNRTTIQNIYTEKDGTFEAIISNPGPWMVSVVRMVPSTQTGAEWQSYWGSLVFGIEK
jgi:uncharacterized GH25 family protein